MGQSMLQFNSRRVRLLSSLGIFACLLANSASAAIVPLVPGNLAQDFPDVTVSRISVSYDAGTDLLHAGIAPGGLLTIDQDGVLPTPDHTLFNSTFDVFVTIDGAGVPSAGTLSLSGNYDAPGGPVVSLTSNTLTGFGYDPSTGDFSFLFDNAIGSVPGFGSVIGINLAGNFPVSNPSGFVSNFNNVGQLGGLGNADVFTPLVINPVVITPVPEPSSMIVWSICSALAGLSISRRARRREAI